MSYINKHEQELIKRRPELVRNLSYTELLTRLDSQAAESNQLIARSESRAQHWFEVACGVTSENGELRARVAELERENTRLRKLVKPKAGKKRDEWEEAS